MTVVAAAAVIVAGQIFFGGSDMKRATHLVRCFSSIALLAAVGCAGRMATVESDPAPEPEPLTEADFHGTYNLYMGGQAIVEGQPAQMTAQWSRGEMVVLQDGQTQIRTGIAIDPRKQEIRIWDPSTTDVLCSSEGIYVYEDDGSMITMSLVADPCTNRAAQADGARLVRR